MLFDAAWIVLHGGAHGGGIASFRTVLGTLVTILVVVGTLYYVGALDPSDATSDDEPDSGLGN